MTAFILILSAWTGPLAFTPDVTCQAVADHVECGPFWSAETCTDALALVNGGGVRGVCISRPFSQGD